jgi:hypothetical protein
MEMVTDAMDNWQGAEAAAVEECDGAEAEDVFAPDPQPRVIRAWEASYVAGEYEVTELLEDPQAEEIVLRTTRRRGVVTATLDIVAEAARLRVFRGWATPTVLRSAVVANTARIVWAETLTRKGWPPFHRGDREVLARWEIWEERDVWGARRQWRGAAFEGATEAVEPPALWRPGTYELARRGRIYEVVATCPRDGETTRVVKEMPVLDVHCPEVADIFQIPEGDLFRTAQEVELNGRMVYWRRDIARNTTEAA